MPKSRLRKIANDSSYLADFAAGVEPTGIFTFRNALENKENHTVHKIMGDVGGFVGGSLLGVLSSAGASKAVAAALRKKSPALAKDFDNSAVGSLEALNPKKLKNYLQAFPELAKYKVEAGKVLADVKHMSKDVDKAKAILADLRDISDSSSLEKRLESLGPEFKSSVLRSRNLRRQLDNLQETEARISSKYFDGASVTEGTEKALSATVGALAGVGGGALNALSAHTQYDTGRATRKKIDAGEYSKEPLKKKASENYIGGNNMYRELLNEIEDIAKTASVEELETLSACVLAGLEKVAVQSSDDVNVLYDHAIPGAVKGAKIGAGVVGIPYAAFGSVVGSVGASAANKTGPGKLLFILPSALGFGAMGGAAGAAGGAQIGGAISGIKGLNYKNDLAKLEKELENKE